MLWVLGGLAAALSVVVALRIDWNPLPVLGALMAAGGVYIWGPKAFQWVRGLTDYPRYTPLDYVAEYFGINQNGDPVQSFHHLTPQEYCRRSPKRSELVTEYDKFKYFDDKIVELRTFFAPIGGSEKQWTFNNVSPVNLPMWLRLALLADFCGLSVPQFRYWRLMPPLCVVPNGYGEKSYFRDKSWKFVYQALYHSPDPEDFAKAYNRIRWLLNGQRLMFTMNPDGNAEIHPWDPAVCEEGKVFEWQAAPEPEAPPPPPEELPYAPLVFSDSQHPHGHLAEGYLYLGDQFLDRHKGGHWLKIEDLNNTLVMGTAGFGKSVFLNQVLEGVLFNQARFDQVVLVDLKGGVELWPYRLRGNHVRVIKDLSEVGPLVAELVAMVQQRLDVMRENGHKMWPGPKTLFVVDEYAQIQTAPENTKEDRQQKQEMLTNLNKLSMQCRAAGVVIWAQLQKGTTDVMDSSFRANLSNQVCFKVPNKLTAAGMFGSTDELMVDPVKLPKGRFIFYDASNGETHYLQSRIIQA